MLRSVPAMMWIFFCCLIFFVTEAQSFNISVPKPMCSSGEAMGIHCYGSAHDVDGPGGGHISMTTDAVMSRSNLDTGWVFINRSVPMMDPHTGQVASFSSRFSFQITPAKNNSNSFDGKPGDGMAFFLFANGSYLGNSGGTLGVYKWQNETYGSLPGHNGTKTFCVEYDTYDNHGIDPNDNHVGVDIESVQSIAWADAGRAGINLKGGYKLTTWIDYDFSRLQLEVRIANASQAKPAKALLVAQKLDLSKIVDKSMYVGIAAATGGSMEYNYLFDLNFATFGLPSPSPSPQPTAAVGNDDSKSKRNMIVGVSTGAVLLFAFVLVCIVSIMRAKRSGRSLGDEFKFTFNELAALDMPYRFTYKQLSVATNGFNEKSKLGEGGFSSVYRGVIPSTGAEVAVKKVTNKSKQGENEFLAEIRAVSRLRHRNLVKLLGWCSDQMNFLLVYELMPNGSLDKPLFQDMGSGDVHLLTWIRRLTILRDVVAALAYLHEGHAEQVIHRDIKSSNVMLDQDFNARLGDFGLARLIDSKNTGAMTMAGTPGYIAPEVVFWSSYTDKTDVYAFGALCLELVCGRRPINMSRPAGEEILQDWVWGCHEEGSILSVVDTRLAADRPQNDSKIMDVLLIGLLCSHPQPEARPSMREVELFLEGHLSLPSVPLCRPTPVYSTQSQLQLKKSWALVQGEAKSRPQFSSHSSISVSNYSASGCASRMHSAEIST